MSVFTRNAKDTNREDYYRLSSSSLLVLFVTSSFFLDGVIL